MSRGVVALLVLAACRSTQQTAPVLDAGDDVPSLYALSLTPRAPAPGRAPVLVLAHGVGANERDLVGLAAQLDGRLAIRSLRAPLPLGPDAWGWFSVRFTPQGPVHDPAQAETARRALVKYVSGLSADPSVDPARVYLLGFSQGAILGLSLVHTAPELLAGVVAVSGRTLPEVSAASRAPGARPPVLLLHGTRDAKLPSTHALQSKAALDTAGREVDFKTYEAGHELNAAMVADVAAWLSARLGP